MSELTEVRWGILMILVGVALVSLVISIATGEQSWDGLLLNLGTEILGAVLLYILLELVIGRRERREAQESALRTKKEDLIARMGSGVQDVAIAATEELRRCDWLCDGSLKRAKLLGANLPGADLSEADLSEADLRRANLNGANLDKANLTYANLSGADLGGASLDNADLKGADLSNATLQDAKGLTDKQLTEAFGLKGATMASGRRYNGRFNLEGDLVLAHSLMKVGHTDEAMAGFYEVSVKTYQWGQEWCQFNESPPMMYSSDMDERGDRWSKVMANPDGPPNLQIF